METFLNTTDYAVSGEQFSLLYDRELELLRTNPVPETLDTYYLSNSYISHTDAKKSLVDRLYQLVKRVLLAKKLKWIRSYAYTERSVLDFGAGTGDFLRKVRKKGWDFEGVEPNPMARGLASEKRLQLYRTLLEVPSREFQIITLWHVLEHLPDIDKDIPALLEYLREDGTLFIAVPNFKSYDAQYYGKFWAAYDVPRHVWHFSRSAIEKIFERHGMELVEVKPLIFDAFYVALLSEKYKGNKWAFLKAMLVGLRSNFRAMKTGEYSSLLYILQRA